MGIKTRMSLGSIFILVLLVLVLITANIRAHYQDLTAKAEWHRFESRIYADHLRQTSDDLTRMARSYVVTGDEKFERYFNEILMIRNGALP